MSQEISVSITNLMAQSGVAFGTSGARGLVAHMTDRVCMAYTDAFLQHLETTGRLQAGATLLVGGDRRPSSPRIMAAVAAAAKHRGYGVRNAGLLPSPALALWGMRLDSPTVMVTGSHIPDDRNGLKFTTAAGEITKADEAGIRSKEVQLPDIFDDAGMFVTERELPPAENDAAELYKQRYVQAFGAGCLAGTRLGLYAHSAVGRELLKELYETLGAQVTVLGSSETFIPVDTEAIRPEDIRLAHGWAQTHQLDVLVSTDGDSDRPLTSDEFGNWLRGDITGILTARFLEADGVAVPVSCNSALELCGSFADVRRTRIGSPFVIAALEELQQAGAKKVVGYEANGGFFTQTPLHLALSGQALPALPTRDPVIVHLAIILLAKAAKQPISALLATLPNRVTASGRDQNIATQTSQAMLSQLRAMSEVQLAATWNLGPVAQVDETDGFRMTFASGEILHLRPSGNAPELRCYAEAPQSDRAEQLVDLGLQVARGLAQALA